MTIAADNAPRLRRRPNCSYTQTGTIRTFRRRFLFLHWDRIECLYYDGWGNYFWAPPPLEIQ